MTPRWFRAANGLLVNLAHAGTVKAEGRAVVAWMPGSDTRLAVLGFADDHDHAQVVADAITLQDCATWADALEAAKADDPTWAPLRPVGPEGAA